MAPSFGSSPVSPSRKSGVTVHEVLKNLRVRDPRNKLDSPYHRRIDDFQIHGPVSETAVLLMITALIVGTLAFISIKAPSRMTPQNLPSIPAAPRASMPRPIPQTVPSQPSATAPRDASSELPTPRNLNTNFMGPLSVELRWNSLGEGYRYFLYAGSSASMKDAQLILRQSVPSPYASWQPLAGIKEAWVAVQGIDSEGQLTPLSRPVRVRFPTE